MTVPPGRATPVGAGPRLSHPVAVAAPGPTAAPGALRPARRPRVDRPREAKGEGRRAMRRQASGSRPTALAKLTARRPTAARQRSWPESSSPASARAALGAHGVPHRIARPLAHRRLRVAVTPSEATSKPGTTGPAFAPPGRRRQRRSRVVLGASATWRPVREVRHSVAAPRACEASSCQLRAAQGGPAPARADLHGVRRTRR